MTTGQHTNAIVFERPGALVHRDLQITAAGERDLLVETEFSGISSGTERLLWEGRMPSFPGLGYPLVPGYESVGRVVERGASCSVEVGDRVFVPGASCYQDDVRGLFGATASRLVVAEHRCVELGSLSPQHGVLLALTATAMHILTHRIARSTAADEMTLERVREHAPQLIIGHGTLGRVLARLCVAVGAPAPLVWERNPDRHSGAQGYSVVAMQDDDRHDYSRVCDVSGACGDLFDDVILRMRPGSEFVLGGFYSEPVSFAFAPAFMREITLSIAAQWLPHDLALVTELIRTDVLSLDGLVSHVEPTARAESAYRQAFIDPECLKMVLDWRDS